MATVVAPTPPTAPSTPTSGAPSRGCRTHWRSHCRPLGRATTCPAPTARARIAAKLRSDSRQTTMRTGPGLPDGPSHDGTSAGSACTSTSTTATPGVVPQGAPVTSYAPSPAATGGLGVTTTPPASATSAATSTTSSARCDTRPTRQLIRHPRGAPSLVSHWLPTRLRGSVDDRAGDDRPAAAPGARAGDPVASTRENFGRPCCEVRKSTRTEDGPRRGVRGPSSVSSGGRSRRSVRKDRTCPSIRGSAPHARSLVPTRPFFGTCRCAPGFRRRRRPPDPTRSAESGRRSTGRFRRATVAPRAITASASDARRVRSAPRCYPSTGGHPETACAPRATAVAQCATSPATPSGVPA